MRHISGRHKITDDEHQSWGPSWKLFLSKIPEREIEMHFPIF